MRNYQISRQGMFFLCISLIAVQLILGLSFTSLTANAMTAGVMQSIPADKDTQKLKITPRLVELMQPVCPLEDTECWAQQNTGAMQLFNLQYTMGEMANEIFAWQNDIQPLDEWSESNDSAPPLGDAEIIKEIILQKVPGLQQQVATENEYSSTVLFSINCSDLLEPLDFANQRPRGPRSPRGPKTPPITGPTCLDEDGDRVRPNQMCPTIGPIPLPQPTPSPTCDEEAKCPDTKAYLWQSLQDNAIIDPVFHAIYCIQNDSEIVGVVFPDVTGVVTDGTSQGYIIPKTTFTWGEGITYP